MEYLNSLFLIMDAWLMPVFRAVETPILGFYLGTAVLASVCVMLGDLTYNIVVRADRSKIKDVNANTVKYNNLSIEALQAGDGDSYRACNKMANEAFGRMFFLQLALSTAALWPLPFALAWMQYRFFEVEFPLAFLPLTFSYAGVFIPMYALLRIGYSKVRQRLPFFSGAARIYAEMGADAEELKTWRDLAPAKQRRG